MLPPSTSMETATRTVRNCWCPELSGRACRTLLHEITSVFTDSHNEDLSPPSVPLLSSFHATTLVRIVSHVAPLHHVDVTRDGRWMQLTFYLNIFIRLPLLVRNTPTGSGILLHWTALAWPLELLKQFCRGCRLCGAAACGRGRC